MLYLDVNNWKTNKLSSFIQIQRSKSINETELIKARQIQSIAYSPIVIIHQEAHGACIVPLSFNMKMVHKKMIFEVTFLHRSIFNFDPWAWSHLWI